MGAFSQKGRLGLINLFWDKRVGVGDICEIRGTFSSYRMKEIEFFLDVHSLYGIHIRHERKNITMFGKAEIKYEIVVEEADILTAIAWVRPRAKGLGEFHLITPPILVGAHRL